MAGIPGPIEAKKIRDEGFFEATLPETYHDRPDPANYRIRFQTHSGASFERYDTYAFPYLSKRIRFVLDG